MATAPMIVRSIVPAQHSRHEKAARQAPKPENVARTWVYEFVNIEIDTVRRFMRTRWQKKDELQFLKDLQNVRAYYFKPDGVSGRLDAMRTVARYWLERIEAAKEEG